MKLVYGLEFPDISEMLVWPDFFAGFNKIALINADGVGAVRHLLLGGRQP